MRELFYILLVVSCSMVSFAFGTGQGEKTAERFLESRVVESYQSGDPFTFVNGKPVVIVATLRSDKTTLYNVRRRADEADARSATLESCEKCHRGNS